VAFVLSGGGNLGAVQIGMLRALAEREIVPDVVLGCSVGAMNGAAYCARPTLAGVGLIQEHWTGLAVGSLMPASRIPNAVQLVRKGTSIHRDDGLRAAIETMLGPSRRFDQLEVEFQCVATEVELATGHWFSEGLLTTAILASAALPIVFPPVSIDGKTFVDGGVVDNVPIARAVELGCREIYVLHVGLHGRPEAEIRRPIDAALQAYWIARNSRFARDLASLPDDVEAIVLPPGQRPDIRFDDFSQTQELIEQGYENSSAFLEGRAAVVAGDRRRSTELLRPVQRLVLSARQSGWMQAVRRAADDPEGAIIGPATRENPIVGVPAQDSDDGSHEPGTDGSGNGTSDMTVTRGTNAVSSRSAPRRPDQSD